jgi:hypothetical protein
VVIGQEDQTGLRPIACDDSQRIGDVIEMTIALVS